MQQIVVDKYIINVVHKKMKSIRLAINASTGQIRISAPFHISEQQIRHFVESKLAWLEKHTVAVKPTTFTTKKYINGETHFLEGKEYQLCLIENSAINKISIKGNATIEMRTIAGATAAKRETQMYNWYRARLEQKVNPLITYWQKVMNVQLNEWGIKKMKSRWGSCNTKAKRIWINTELAKKPDRLLEYLIVHELAHLLEASHNEVFKAYMDKFIPDWRQRRRELNGKK
ncbi:MAG: SprT family zinc-dependent metalloprotease [Candidatus Cloacimonetes bacterium]|nr:SprT family zinc-dependent metalloprotease [Candidatus Cloacimonadota bacterium]